MPKKLKAKKKSKSYVGRDDVPKLIYITVSNFDDEDDDEEPDEEPMLLANRSLEGMANGTMVYVFELKEVGVVDVVSTLRTQKPAAVRKP